MSTSPAAVEISSSTPILDRQQPVPPALHPTSKTRRSTIIVLVAVILMIGIWIASMIWVPGVWEVFYAPAQQIQRFLDKALENTFSDHLRNSLSLWRFWTPWLGIFLALTVHELGHTFACLLVSFRILAVRVGRLQISPPFRITWRQPALPGASGFTRFVPDHSHRLRARALAVLFAGPLANLVSALAIVLLTTPTLFTVSFVALSVAMGLGNLIPFRRKAVVSDGKRILMQLHNSQKGERWLALLQLTTDLQNGVEAKKLSLEFITVATAIQDDSLDTVAAHAIAYASAFQRHEDVEAARLLEVCLKYSGFAPPLLRDAVFTDAVIFQARRRKRADLAEQWLAKLPQEMAFPEHRFHAEAAILEAKGDVAGALKKLDDAEAIVLKSAEPRRRELSLRYLRRWRAELEQNQPLAVS